MVASLCQFCSYSFYNSIRHIVVDSCQSRVVAYFGSALYSVAYPGDRSHDGAVDDMYACVFHLDAGFVVAEEF